MTREKAIERVSRWLDKGKQHEDNQLGYIEGWFTKEDEQAFLMAIEALQTEQNSKLICYSILPLDMLKKDVKETLEHSLRDAVGLFTADLIPYMDVEVCFDPDTVEYKMVCGLDVTSHKKSYMDILENKDVVFSDLKYLKEDKECK